MKTFVLFLSIIIAFLPTVSVWGENRLSGTDFDWGNATVYFVITDRFCNGDSTNDVNYGRIVDYGSERLNAATFHGGDFKGMLRNCLLYTSPSPRDTR